VTFLEEGESEPAKMKIVFQKQSHLFFLKGNRGGGQQNTVPFFSWKKHFNRDILRA
jgi:hypothetical protein